MNTPFHLEHNAHGRLVLINTQGERVENCVPVRAFPLGAPDEGISVVNADGHEVVWIEQLSALPQSLRALLETALQEREFTPEIRRIVAVSTFSTPSQWTLETDRGPTQLQLAGEEDIRRLSGGALLIADAQGVHFKVKDVQALDRASRKLLERFL
jgi:hypothetical protein